MQGLTSQQVQSRIAAGEVNHSKSSKIKITHIIKRHAVTLFNIVITILALIVLFFGRKRDALFIIIAFFSTALAIINDIRAKLIVDRLKLISERPITVIRNNQEVQISPANIVKDDIIKLSLGDQIVVDAQIITGELEVNESLITGEANNIKKHAKDYLTSGSFVVAGTCLAQATAVGEKSYISKIILNTQKIKNKRSRLFLTIDKIIRINSIILIPVGFLLFAKQIFIDATTAEAAVTSTVAALVAMIPEGLILLISSILTLSTIRLAKQKVLVQDFYSIETLARVDTICLDKTGTLTTGNMRVEKIIPLDNHSSREIKETIKLINGALGNINATTAALISKYGQKTAAIDKAYHFSSDQKFSGIKIGNTKYLMGALEFMDANSPLRSTEQQLATDYRVISVIKVHNKQKNLLGFVLLSDEIRANAKETLNFFSQNNVQVKIISGDNLPTIQKTLQTLGLPFGQAIDLSTIKKPNYASLVKTNQIFARVTPSQKRSLVYALQKSGHTVAMTGDGVNDCLALKEADCGIAIGAGADAARRISDIVLLDSDFSAIPQIIFEGRKTINNITRSSTLFLSKTFFATILSIVFIFLNARYPFSPIEMSLINLITIGIPSFILALEPNYSRVSNNFKALIISNSLPSALATIFTTITIALIANSISLPWQDTITLSYITTSFIGLLLICKISLPLNRMRTILLVGLAALAISPFCFSSTRSFFEITIPDSSLLSLILALSSLATLIFATASRLLSRQST